MSGRKTDLGISVYPRPGDDVCRKEIEDYISQAARLGYRKVFSSLHLPEDDIDALAGNVLWLSEVVHGSGMELILDLSSTELRQLLGRREHVRRLKAAKAAYLRLDYGFTELDIRRVTGDLGIQGFVLNASVLTGEEIGEMVDCIRAHAGSSAAIEACHNFYPRPETGLAIEFMIEKSNLYKPL
ncbi:MAG: MupG family TIM beta-alpha barrel fold protein, partial [Bacillota bacterium]